MKQSSGITANKFEFKYCKHKYIKKKSGKLNLEHIAPPKKECNYLSEWMVLLYHKGHIFYIK